MAVLAVLKYIVSQKLWLRVMIVDKYLLFTNPRMIVGKYLLFTNPPMIR